MNMKNEIKSAVTTLLFCAAISCNVATGADLPAQNDIKMEGEAEDGGIVFQIGKSQVLIKISGNMTAEIDHQNNQLIIREGGPEEGDEIQYQSASEASGAVEYTKQYADTLLDKMRKK